MTVAIRSASRLTAGGTVMLRCWVILYADRYAAMPEVAVKRAFGNVQLCQWRSHLTDPLGTAFLRP